MRDLTRRFQRAVQALIEAFIRTDIGNKVTDRVAPMIRHAAASRGR